jgi:8-oxo-dGTP diphosphatase
MLKNGAITYQAMKRLKNFFDYFNVQNGDKIQYALAGGELMKSFIDRTLNANRDAVKRSKDVRRDVTSNPNSELKPYQTPRLTEGDNKKEKKELVKNAVAVIVNDDNKILLLKRADEPKTWMPKKWALVGGAIEKGETPEKACKREIKEETDLDIDKFVKTFSIQRNPDSIEHVFACRFKGDESEINLNKENTNYGWFDIKEMKFLDTVPHLIEYITLIFKKYE